MAESKSHRVDVKALKERVGSDWLSLLQDLAPELEEACEEIPEHVACPMHGGQDGFRFFDDAEETGGGVCNTCGPFSDGIKLLMELKGWTFFETCKKIEAWLDNVDDLWDEDEEESELARQKARNDKKAEEAMKAERMRQQFLEYLHDLQERAEGEHERLVAYYRNRGLSIEPSENLGFVEEEEYYDKETGNHQMLPAMAAIFQDPSGEAVGVLRTYLDSDGDGKADVAEPKKCKAIRKGATMGAAIRLHEAGDVLGVAEGIETAEAVFEATGVPTWATCAANRLEKVVVPEGVAEVQIWADNDSGGAGQVAAGKLAKRLVGEGIRVKVLLPPEVDKDWLDVLVEEGKEVLQNAVAATPHLDPSHPVATTPVKSLAVQKPTGMIKASFSKADLIKAASNGRIQEVVKIMNVDHFIVPVGSQVLIATEVFDPAMKKNDLRLGKVTDFNLLYANVRVTIGDDKFTTAAKLWVANMARREYKGIVFAPREDVPEWYNLWRGFSVQPTAGDCSLFWQHVFFVICRENTTHYRYLRKWMAHMIQKPQELPGVAIVIIGKQGTGKGFFADMIGALIKDHYLVLTSVDSLVGQFSGHLKDALLVYANEAAWGGNKAGEGVLKAMVTDPITPVEEKFKDLINVRNCKRILVTTNKAWAVPMEADDRRFLVLQASDRNKEDGAYFTALNRQMYQEGGLQALLHDLMREDLTGFEVRRKPASEHGFDIKIRSAEPIAQWWYDRLSEGTHGIPQDLDQEDAEWEQTPVKKALHGSFLAFCETHKCRSLTLELFGKELRKMLPVGTLGETRPKTRAQGSAMSTRPHRYRLPPLEECRRAFEVFFSSGAEIWNT